MTCPFHNTSRGCPYRKSRCPFANAADESRKIEDLYSRGLIDTIERGNQKDRMIKKYGLPLKSNAMRINKRTADALYDEGLIDSLSRDLRIQNLPRGIGQFGESIGLETHKMCVNGICKEIAHVIVLEDGNGPVSEKLKKTIQQNKPKTRSRKKRSRSRKRKSSRKKRSRNSRSRKKRGGRSSLRNQFKHVRRSLTPKRFRKSSGVGVHLGIKDRGVMNEMICEKSTLSKLKSRYPNMTIQELKHKAEMICGSKKSLSPKEQKIANCIKNNKTRYQDARLNQACECAHTNKEYLDFLDKETDRLDICFQDLR